MYEISIEWTGNYYRCYFAPRDDRGIDSPTNVISGTEELLAERVKLLVRRRFLKENDVWI